MTFLEEGVNYIEGSHRQGGGRGEKVVTSFMDGPYCNSFRVLCAAINHRDLDHLYALINA